jgi:hypothetical protein
VIKPQVGVPSAVVHFTGGVFVGAAPQLTYRLFLERLAERYDFCLSLELQGRVHYKKHGFSG